MNTQQGPEQQQITKKQHIYQESSQQYTEATYVHQKYPKWKYHIHDADRAELVKNEQGERDLGPEWQDKRPAVKKPAKSQEELRQENEELKKQLAALKK